MHLGRQYGEHKRVETFGVGQGLLELLRLGLHRFAGVAEFGNVRRQASANFTPS